MTAANGADQRVTGVRGAEKGAGPRRTRRAPFHELIAVDAPDLTSAHWVVDCIDLNSKGMGLVLPPELLEGTRVLLSFVLDGRELSRVPATVQHKIGVSGGVRFDPWPETERLKLIEYLVSFYETID